MEESYRLPKQKRTRMAICTYNARTLASEAAIENLMIQGRKIKYDEHATVEVLVELASSSTRVWQKNIDSFKQLTTQIGHLRMRRCGPTPALTIFVAYAPTSGYKEEVEAFYMDPVKIYREDPAFYKVIIGDFNAKVGPRRTPEELHIGTHGLQWNDQGERLSEFIMTTKTIHGNSQFQKSSSLRWTGSDHCLLRGRFSFTRKGEKAAKFRERNPRTITNWDPFAITAGLLEDYAMDNIDEEYERLVEHLHKCTKKVESFKTTKRRLSLDTLELIHQRGEARAAGNQELTSKRTRLCREAINEDINEGIAEVFVEDEDKCSKEPK
ncbi:hypothetical protein RB195_010423 [Necator americanus]|uniref:Endonuclease/exonuclease/phosphatase domain-containing protein n=1 Tax=Necator americanus TaxID=51031 RepID=A0ABR1CXV7_NECAM